MPFSWIADWEQSYVAWAIQHAVDLGFSGGTRLRDRICRWILKEFTSDAEGFDGRFGVNYVSAIGTNRIPGDMNSEFLPFTNMAQVFNANFPAPIEGDANGNYHHSVNYGPGWTGPDTRMALVVAAQNALPAATDALNRVWHDLGEEIYVNNASDLGYRAQFAFGPNSNPGSGPPRPPAAVRITP